MLKGYFVVKIVSNSSVKEASVRSASHEDGDRDVENRVEEVVFRMMQTTDIPDIKVTDVVREAGIARSTFYRHYKRVDDVVKTFEDGILDHMRAINKVALNSNFGRSELDPTPSMVERMKVLLKNRDKIVALNGVHGDPQFVHKATVMMHDHFRARLRGVVHDETDMDLYLAFVISGHNNLIEYWLEERPDIDPVVVAAMLNRLFYTPFFVDKTNARDYPYAPHFSLDEEASRKGHATRRSPKKKDS